MAFLALEKLHRLCDGYRNLVRVEQRELLILQERGQLYIVENRCPHMDAPLQYGAVTNGYIRCPLHGIEFELRSGQAKPPSCLKGLKTFEPVYEGNTVGIDLHQE